MTDSQAARTKESLLQLRRGHALPGRDANRQP